MKERFMRFMYGRYGNDQLNRFLLFLSMAALVLSMITGKQIFWIAAIAILVVTYIRLFSKNISKRYEENQKYLGIANRVTGWFKLRIKHIKERKTHRFFACPSCKQKVRVPKGKGNICITCPKCRTQFQKRS